MERFTMEVLHVVDSRPFIYQTQIPTLPDGCEECGALKGASFELRLLYLIKSKTGRHLCESCLKKEMAERKRRNSVAPIDYYE
jgi:hypothetical protein